VHRRGVGRALYAALLEHLRLLGYVTAYGGITQPNEASAGLHKAMGFESAGYYEGVGFKLGRWHDVAWVALRLQTLPESPADPRSPKELSLDPRWEQALREGERLLRL
jgi:L-amino acid N-acyltransferase YncA